MEKSEACLIFSTFAWLVHFSHFWPLYPWKHFSIGTSSSSSYFLILFCHSPFSSFFPLIMSFCGSCAGSFLVVHHWKTLFLFDQPFAEDSCQRETRAMLLCSRLAGISVMCEFCLKVCTGSTSPWPRGIGMEVIFNEKSLLCCAAVTYCFLQIQLICAKSWLASPLPPKGTKDLIPGPKLCYHHCTQEFSRSGCAPENCSALFLRSAALSYCFAWNSPTLHLQCFWQCKPILWFEVSAVF